MHPYWNEVILMESLYVSYALDSSDSKAPAPPDMILS